MSDKTSAELQLEWLLNRFRAQPDCACPPGPHWWWPCIPYREGQSIREAIDAVRSAEELAELGINGSRCGTHGTSGS